MGDNTYIATGGKRRGNLVAIQKQIAECDEKIKKLTGIQKNLEEVRQKLNDAKKDFSKSEDAFAQNYVSNTAKKEIKKYEQSIKDIKSVILGINEAIQESAIKIKEQDAEKNKLINAARSIN